MGFLAAGTAGSSLVPGSTVLLVRYYICTWSIHPVPTVPPPSSNGGITEAIGSEDFQNIQTVRLGRDFQPLDHVRLTCHSPACTRTESYEAGLVFRN
ncbi:hypothetical protein PDE_00657 [Penicillium oxalicum 114-2]|uniref:Uncharacterized protein n=1 Tax=Penicillium oxalicum (strain 114-2 / CGMCC 5302) TaxID=933388 RepID=S7ZAK7_PENO1|nr:hypothetical protein PDE_00657 [Penicillium oxalicum 114-2]